MVCKLKEKFAFYYIKQLFDINFGKKSQIFITRPPPAVILPAILSALFTSSSPTSDLSAPIPAYITIHFTQPLSIKSMPKTYSTTTTFDTLILYLLGTRSIPVAYM